MMIIMLIMIIVIIIIMIMNINIYIYIYIYNNDNDSNSRPPPGDATVSSRSFNSQNFKLRVSNPRAVAYQDSAKGGAVETGCSGLHDVIGCFSL